jgi:cytochrome c
MQIMKTSHEFGLLQSVSNHFNKCLVLGIAIFFGVSGVHASELLAKSKNCVACHSVSTKIIGPSYKDIAKKYASDDGAAAKLAQKIIKGGSGVWGSVPMPPNAQVKDDEALKLAEWILSQK